MDKVRELELNEYWNGDIYTEDKELKEMISKLDAIIKKGNN
jgi:hypothetical protein